MGKEYPVRHTCKVNSYCHLNEFYKLWFCDICKQVTTVEINGKIHPLFIKDNVKDTEYKKEDLSDDTRRELI